MNQPPTVFRAAVPITALAAFLALVACAGDGAPATAPSSSPTTTSADKTIRVGATLSLFADFAREVGRDSVDVFSILPTGADPHTYEATPSDLRRIAEADVIFVNSLEPGVEGSILDVIRNNKNADAVV
ncbi:MAG: zinc ABC transporter substrate-binding protein, partial [Dehalococcoidia bacterium]